MNFELLFLLLFVYVAVPACLGIAALWCLRWAIRFLFRPERAMID
jgi:hypothetical protein